MIIRRFVVALRRQDWGTAALEFLIVVAGIFVGLQVDDWQRVLENRRLEADYISRLAIDLHQDIDTFKAEIVQFERKAEFIEHLLDGSVSKRFAVAPNRVMENKVYSSFRGVPAVKRTTFDELTSTGRLTLIADTSLRGALSDYYADYSSFEEQINFYNISDYPGLINGYVPGRVAREWRLEGTISEPGAFVASLEALAKDPNLLVAANSEISYAAAVEHYLLSYIHRAEALLAHLEQSSAKAGQE
jgi:hypothetical protein